MTDWRSAASYLLMAAGCWQVGHWIEAALGAIQRRVLRGVWECKSCGAPVNSSDVFEDGTCRYCGEASR